MFYAVHVYTSDYSLISLYKNGSKTVGGGNLSYPNIDLKEFCSFVEKESVFKDFLYFVYYAENVNEICKTKDNYLIYTGPIYYKANPGIKVQPTGSYIVHLGNITEFSMNKTSGLKYYILFK